MHRMKKMIAICCLSIPFILQGCITSSIEAQRKSFEPYEALSINGTPIKRFLNSRTAFIATSADYEFTISNRDDTMTFASKIRGDSLSSAGMAVAISADGYFITAEHVIRERGAMLFYSSSNGAYIETARVVKSFPEIDLAILKVGYAIREHFKLEPREFTIGTRLFAGGMSVNSFSSGELLSLKEKTLDEFSYFVFETSLPLRRGDSGGPSVDASGHLVGISVKLAAGILSEPRAPKGYGVMLDVRYLQSVIEKDRKAHKDSI